MDRNTSSVAKKSRPKRKEGEGSGLKIEARREEEARELRNGEEFAGGES